MLRLFLDTNILISATFWKGSSYRLTLKIIEGDAIGFTREEVLREYRWVLRRDFGLNEEEIDERTEKLLEFLEIVLPKETIAIIQEDPFDNRIIEGAIVAEAEFIVSYDQHLLKIKSFRNIKIIRPEEILEKW